MATYILKLRSILRNISAERLLKLQKTNNISDVFGENVLQSSFRRFYSVQSVLNKVDSSNTQENGSMHKELSYANSILNRGGFLRKRTIENLISSLEHSQETLSPIQTLFLLRCCSNTVNCESPAVRNALVVKLWETYQKKDIPLDISHYNALLLIFLENESVFSPLDFLSNLESKQIQPNRITFNRLIAKYCQDGDIEGANKILEFMKEQNLPIGDYVFNQLIIGNSRAKDLEGAKNILDVMKESGVEPNPETFAALLQAHAEHRDAAGFDQILEKCDRDGIILPQKSVMDLVAVLAEKGLKEPITKLLQNVKKTEGYDSLVAYGCARLLHSGQDAVAFELYKTMDFREDLNYSRPFFLKQLAASPLDLYKVVNYCEEIKQNGWNVLSYELSLESFLNEHKFDRALAFLRVMSEKGLHVNDHYFYPLLLNAAKNGNAEDAWAIFEESVRLGAKYESEAVCDFVISSLRPAASLDSFSDLYMRLSNAQGDIDLSLLYNGVVLYLLKHHSLDLVAEFVNKYKRGVFWSSRLPLRQQYLKDLDAASAVCVLRQMLPLNVRMNKEINDDDSVGLSGIRDFLGLIMSNQQARDSMDKVLIPLLQAMHAEGIPLTEAVVEYLKRRFPSSLSDESTRLLDDLCRPDVVSNLRGRIPDRKQPSATSVSSLQERIAEAEANGDSCDDLKSSLLIQLLKHDNFEEKRKYYDKLVSEGVDISPNLRVMMMSAMMEEGQFEEAEQFVANFLEQNSGYQLSPMIVVKWAHVLSEQERFHDAAKFLLMNSPEDGKWTEDFASTLDNLTYQNRLRRLLRRVSQSDDVQTLKLVQEALLSRDFAKPSVVLPELVKFYINRGELDQAMTEFEKIAQEHKITAAKDVLTVAFIQQEDSEKIQRILDVSIEIHGEMNSLYDLVFSFVELDQLDQARKVIQTNGMRTLQNRLDSRCDFYLRTRRFSQLQGLVEVTKGLFNINRPAMYEYLLRAKIMQDIPEEALGVWTSMQEEGVEPSQVFLRTLSSYLTSKGLEVPFVVPETPRRDSGTFSLPTRAPRPLRTRTERAAPTVAKPTKSELETALDSDDLELVKSTVEKYRSENLAISAVLHSRYIGTLLRNDRLSESVEEAKSLLARGDRPSVNVMRGLFQKLAESGDVASVRFFEKYLDDEWKRLTFYSNSLFSAHFNSGQVDRYLEAAHEDPDCLITSRAVHTILDRAQESFPNLLKIAENRKQAGNSSVFNYIWDGLFNLGRKEEAEKIYEDNIKDLDNFSVNRTCATSYAERDTAKLDSLLEVVERKPTGREALKGYIYSTYLNILVDEERHEEGLRVLNKALETVTPYQFRRDCLSRMKNAVEKNGMKMPIEVPIQVKNASTKASSSSSSSSSSDEDKK